MTGTADKSVQATDSVLQEVNDALALVAYAVETGAQGDDGPALSRDDIATITTVAAALGFFATPPEESAPAPTGGSLPGPQARAISPAEWVDFEVAYYNVAKALSPITAETLRNTEATSQHVGRDPSGHPIGGTRRWLTGMMLGFSPAQSFARALAAITIAFAVVVLLSEWLIYVYSLEGDESLYRGRRELLRMLVPWCYGGLGACVYLLKNAHTFIYGRCFDLRRKPEYVNRIVLGAISGGAIMLFVKYLGGEDGGGVQLSAAAIGFLAGYSTDFLFGTIERVIAALFPKVDADEGTPKAPPPAKPAEPPAPPGQA